MDEASHASEGLPDLFTAREWRAIAAYLALTDQQRRIARWVCRGLSNKAIADRLGVCQDTVRMHSRTLYKKLGIRSRMGVPVRAVLAARHLVETREL